MSSIRVPSRSRKTARRPLTACERHARARGATAGRAPSGSVRGSSSTRPPPTRATTGGIPQPEPQRQAVGAERARVEAHQRRRQVAPGKEPPPTADSPGSSAGRELPGGQPAARRRGALRRAPRRSSVSIRSTGISRDGGARGRRRARAWPRARRGSACRPAARGRADCRTQRRRARADPPGIPPGARRAACRR